MSGNEEDCRYQACQFLPEDLKVNKNYFFTPHLSSYIKPVLQNFYQAPAEAANTQREKVFCHCFTCNSSETVCFT